MESEDLAARVAALEGALARAENTAFNALKAADRATAFTHALMVLGKAFITTHANPAALRATFDTLVKDADDQRAAAGIEAHPDWDAVVSVLTADMGNAAAS